MTHWMKYLYYRRRCLFISLFSKIFYIIRWPKWRAFTKHYPHLAATIKKVRAKKLTYLDRSTLTELAQVVLTQKKQLIEGAMLEMGCALGGSAIVLASAKAREKPFYLYDVFGMIPPPSERDSQDVHARYQVIKSGRSAGIGGERYYGYQADLYEKVQGYFSAFDLVTSTHNIQLIKGLYEDTLQINFPVALAHIDCDWYDSVKVCLERIVPHLVIGGTLIIDDYYCYSGCRQAVDDYFQHQDQGKYKFEKKNRLHIVRLA